MRETPVELRRTDGSLAQASLQFDLRAYELLLIEKQWAPARLQVTEELAKRGVPPDQWPQSSHWNWANKSGALLDLEACAFGLICDVQWQAAMLTKASSHFARNIEDLGKPLVYVEFLETAPWNWKVPRLATTRRYRRLGEILMRTAVEQSIGEGFHGRLGLHALSQAEGFYAGKCGMTVMERDPAKQDLRYFEFSREQAARFLAGGGGS